MRNIILQGKEQYIIPMREDNFGKNKYSILPLNPRLKKEFLEKYKTDTQERCRFEPLSSNQVEFQLRNVKQVTFEITDACNLNCRYCAYGELYNDFDKRKATFMDSQVAKTLLKYLADFWNSSSNRSFKQNISVSFYGGEPLLHMPFIKDIVAYCEHLNLKYNLFVFSLTTNALLLNKNIAFFAEKEFDLLVSLDGNRENNSYRVFHNNKDSFVQVINNLKKTRIRYPDYFRDHIHFNTVLHNRNSVTEVYDFFKTNFAKYPSIGELSTSGIKKDKLGEYDKMFNNSTQSLSSSDKRKKIQHNMFLKLGIVQNLGIFLGEFSGNIFSTYLGVLFDNKVIKRMPTGTCMPFSKKLFVTVNGKILPCERIGHQFQLGTVNKKSVNIDCLEISEMYNNYFEQIIPQCSVCKNKMACTQCVFHLENLNANPTCYGFKNEKGLEKYTDSMINLIRDDASLYENILNSSTII